MEISVNGKILIPLTEMVTNKFRKTEMENFETETDKFGYIRFVSVVFDIAVHIYRFWSAILSSF